MWQDLKNKNLVVVKKGVRFLFRTFGIFKLNETAEKVYAAHCLKKNAKTINGSGEMRVAFIVYEPGMWDKQLPIYEEMLKREGLKPFIIVVPDNASSPQVQEKKRDFFLNNYENVILYDENTLNRFKKGEFHYAFYQTPYNFKYPKKIRPIKLVRHAKLCFVPYGYIGSKEFFEVSSKDDFFRNIYFGFMDSESMYELLRDNYSKHCERGYKNFEFLGYPAFEDYIGLKGSESIKNVLWLPRWSYAEKGGGSHFLEHKDEYNRFAFENKDVSFTMRPHPLMFESLANQELFSREEALVYRKEAAEAKVHIDEHSLPSESLGNTDLLIADYSSLIVMYFLTGRPVIYCDGGIELSGIYEQLYKFMYIAKSWEEAERIAKEIIKGNDPLKAEREKAAEEIAKKHKNAAKRITDRICEDFKLR